MSFAIHLFMPEKFSEESYRRFLGNVQNLYGKWVLEESVPFNESLRYTTIHECWIKAGDDIPSSEWFRVNIEAHRHLKHEFVWPYDYEWHLRIETSAGRRPLGLVVQLGAWLLGMHTFRFNLALDRDNNLKNEPTEFRSTEAAFEHTRRVLREEFGWSTDETRRGIVSNDGYLLLPWTVSQ